MLVTTSRARIEVLEEGRGAPLVLLHPFPFAADALADQLRALAASARVIAPSMRGFGGSDAFDRATPPSIDAMADDVVAVLDAMDIAGPVVVGGVSMGGYVALAVARRAPARVAGLVLADTRAAADDDAGRAARDKAIALVEGGGLSEYVEGSLPKLLGPKTLAARPDVVLRVRSAMEAASARAIVDGLVALRDRPDATAGLPSIAVPTVVIVGADDGVTPPPVAEALARGIAGAELVSIAEAGHLSNLEQPDAFASAVRALLGRVGRVPVSPTTAPR